MTQDVLDRAVCRATGEDLREIRRRGFSVADPAEVNYDPEPWDEAQVIEWDEHDLPRIAARKRRTRSPRRLRSSAIRLSLS